MDTEKIAGLTLKQSTFLAEYAKTDNLSHACKMAGIHRSTGYRYIENQDFKDALHQMKTKIVNAAWTKLTNSLEEAVTKVVEILNDPKTTTNAKLRATELIFNYTSHYTDNRDIINRMERLEDNISAKKDVNTTIKTLGE